MSWAAAEVIACGPHRVEAFISTVKFAIAADTSGGIVVGTAADIVVGTSVDVVVGTAVDIVGTAAVGAASLTDAASVVGEARVQLLQQYAVRYSLQYVLQYVLL